MEPVGTEDGSDVVFVNTALTCKNGTNRGVLFTGKDTGYMYCQGESGNKVQRKTEEGHGYVRSVCSKHEQQLPLWM